MADSTASAISNWPGRYSNLGWWRASQPEGPKTRSSAAFSVVSRLLTAMLNDADAKCAWRSIWREATTFVRLKFEKVARWQEKNNTEVSMPVAAGPHV